MSSAFRAGRGGHQPIVTLARKVLRHTSTVDTVGTLLLGAVTNGGAETDESRLALLLLRLKNGVVDALQVA